MSKNINITVEDNEFYIDHERVRKEKQANCQHSWTEVDKYPELDDCGNNLYYKYPVCSFCGFDGSIPLTTELDELVKNPDFKFVIEGV